MRLPKSIQKIKAYFTQSRKVDAALLGLIVFLVGIAAYQMWFIQRGGATANQIFAIAANVDLVIGSPAEKAIVASKNGTVYYLPTCGGAKRIKEKDMI